MCYSEWTELNSARARFGEDSPQYRAALGRYLACMEGIYETRASRSASETVESYERWVAIEQAWEQLFGRIKPPRPRCGERSLAVRDKMFADTGTAMTFSEGLQKAFETTGIQLEKDEAFACLVCVVKKPQYVSEALALDPLGVKTADGPRLCYILSPGVMKPMLTAVEQDRIKP